MTSPASPSPASPSPASPTTGPAPGDREDDREDERDAGQDAPGASTPVFWLLLLTAAVPLLACAGRAALLLTTTDERFVSSGDGYGPVTTADRWVLVLDGTTPGWAALLSALVALTLLGALAAARPSWVGTGRAGAWGTAAVGAGAALLALAGLAARAWDLVRDPTAREVAATTSLSFSRTVTDGWPDVGTGVAAVLLGVLVVVLAVRRSGRPDGPPPAGGRTVAG